MTAPLKQFIGEANRICKDFLWDNKWPKIKHCTLTGDYVIGSYKSVDSDTKFHALKIIWISKLLDDDPQKSIASHLYQHLRGASAFIEI